MTQILNLSLKEALCCVCHKQVRAIRLEPRRAIIDCQPARANWAICSQPGHALALSHERWRQRRIPNVRRDTNYKGPDVQCKKLSQYFQRVRFTPAACYDNFYTGQIPHNGLDERQLPEYRFLGIGLRVCHAIEVEKKNQIAPSYLIRLILKSKSPSIASICSRTKSQSRFTELFLQPVVDLHDYGMIATAGSPHSSGHRSR